MSSEAQVRNTCPTRSCEVCDAMKCALCESRKCETCRWRLTPDVSERELEHRRVEFQRMVTGAYWLFG